MACRSNGRSRSSTAPKARDKNEVEINEFRAECRTFAQYWVDTQREEFKRLGVIGDWQKPLSDHEF